MPDKNNEFYIGIDNPLTIVAENISCQSLIVKASSGKITGNSGHYNFTDSKVGRVEITVFVKKKNQIKKIGTYSFRSKRLWDPVAFVGPSSGGDIKKELLQRQMYIRATLLNSDFQANASVESFTFIVLARDTCSYKSIVNKGNKFNLDVIDALQHIKTNDTVIFEDIIVTWFDSKRTILPIIFKVID
jgi:hypothetical protein